MSYDPIEFLVRNSVLIPNVRNLILMVTAVINLDFVPLFFFFFLYSALEILIARTMEDYRFRLIEIEEDFEDEDVEDDEFDGEEAEDDDFEDEEREIILPIDLDVFYAEELEGDEDFDDEEDFEDEEDYEEEEELFPAVRMLPRDPIEYDDYEDEDDDGVDYEDEDEDGVDYEDEDDDGVDYEDEDDDGVDYGDEDLDEGDYDEEELEELFPVQMTSPRVSSSIFHGRTLQGSMVINNGVLENSNNLESCEGKPENHENAGGEIHGWFCPICFEAWTSGGDHQICCLPCGHIYGLSCIKKWLHQSRTSGKCPQCNNLCTFKDVRVLYASRLCVADEELHKRVRLLEARCAYLEQKAVQPTPDELIDQICRNPETVQRLATVLAELHQQPLSL